MKKNIWLKDFVLFFLIIIFHQFFLKDVYAIRYSLIAPSGTLTRDQTVTFTINIDTQGETVTEALVGMTYETQYLEYINTLPSDAFPNLTTTPQEGGKLIFQASSSGFNGSATFAQVNFKIIADAPGSSQLCVLWEVSPTPSSQPPQSPQPTQPSPTTIPRGGQNRPAFIGLTIGSIFFVSASLGLVAAKKFSFKSHRQVMKSDADESKNKQSPQ